MHFFILFSCENWQLEVLNGCLNFLYNNSYLRDVSPCGPLIQKYYFFSFAWNFVSMYFRHQSIFEIYSFEGGEIVFTQAETEETMNMQISQLNISFPMYLCMPRYLFPPLLLY